MTLGGGVVHETKPNRPFAAALGLGLAMMRLDTQNRRATL